MIFVWSGWASSDLVLRLITMTSLNKTMPRDLGKFLLSLKGLNKRLKASRGPSRRPSTGKGFNGEAGLAQSLSYQARNS